VQRPAADPTTSREFRQIPGIGEQKLKDFAAPFLSEIKSFLVTNPGRALLERNESI
jgi:hypothetical protein